MPSNNVSLLLRRERFPVWDRISLLTITILLLALLCGCIAHQGQLDSLRRLSLYDRETAIRNLQRDYRSSPKDWQAYFLGELMADQGQYSEMNYWFARSLTLSDHHLEQINYRRTLLWNLHASRGDSLFLSQDYPAAIAEYEQALAIDPNNGASKLRRMEAEVFIAGPDLPHIEDLVAAGTPGAVFRWLRQENSSPSVQGDEVLVQLRRQLAAKPGCADAALVIAELARVRNDHSGMVHYYEQVLRWGGDYGTGIEQVRRSLARSFLEEALAAFEGGQPSSALGLLDSTEVLQPEMRESIDTRKAILSFMGDHGQSDLDRLLSQDAQVATTWLEFTLADLYLKNRFSDAARIADELIARSPRHTAALLARARWRQECGARGEAIEDLEIILASTTDPGIAYNIGILSMELSRYEDARSHFGQAVRLGFPEGKALRQQTLLSFYEGDFDRMLSQAKRLTRLRGEEQESWRFLTIAAQMTGDEEVYRECKRVLETWGAQS